MLFPALCFPVSPAMWCLPRFKWGLIALFAWRVQANAFGCQMRTAFLFSISFQQSPAFESWKALERQFGCGHTTFKNWKNGKRLLPRTIFNQFLNELEPSLKEHFNNAAIFLPENWGAVKGGNAAIQKLRELLGNQGYLDHFVNFRKKRKTNSGVRLAEWCRLLRQKEPVEYAHLMQRRADTRRKHFFKNPQQFRERMTKTILERYGEHHYTKLGLAVAEKLPLSSRETAVLNATHVDKGIIVKQHVTFMDFNVDFAYYRNGQLIAVEEVPSFKKQKCSLFFDLLVLYEKFKKLREIHSVPFLVTTWFEEKATGRICRFPADLALWCLEKGMVLSFLDNEVCRKMREGVLQGHSDGTEISKTRTFVQSRLQDLRRFAKGAVSQRGQPFDPFETQVHEFLSEHGFAPRGKKMLQTRFGTFIVTDNFLDSESPPKAVFLSKKHLDCLIGSAALVKELVEEPIQTICVTEAPVNRVRQKQKALAQKYIDKYYPSISSITQQASF